MKAHRLHFNLIVIVSNSNFWSIEPKEDFGVPIFTVGSVHKWVKLKLTVGSRPACGDVTPSLFPFFLSSGRLYKQSKVYLPEPPFPHSEVRLLVFKLICLKASWCQLKLHCTIFNSFIFNLLNLSDFWTLFI